MHDGLFDRQMDSGHDSALRVQVRETRSVFSTKLESSKSRKATRARTAWQPDSDEDLIDTGRCRRTKLCKVVGFRSLKPLTG